MNLLITGANGQLGSEIKHLSNQYPNYQFHFCDRQALDITDKAAIKQILDQYAIDMVINCAAYTQVDKAETEEEQAYAINATAVGYLARHCKERGIVLLHISTDFVFDGNKRSPYLETDEVNPIGVYAASKLKGEQILQEIAPAFLIIRTSWVFSSFGKNFVKTIRRLGASREELNVVDDQQGRPTYARDLAQTLLTIIGQLETKHYGQIYHFANEGGTTWFGFAKAIMQQSNLACVVQPIPTSGYPTPAKRPAYSVLDTQKVSSTFALSIPHWEDALERVITALED